MDTVYGKRAENVHLCFMVPGFHLTMGGQKVKREPKSLHGMMNRFVDDLLEGYHRGYAAVDANLPVGQPDRLFRSPAILLSAICDWPGGCHLCECTSSGFDACRFCRQRGATNTTARTTVFPGGRRALPERHWLRTAAGARSMEHKFRAPPRTNASFKEHGAEGTWGVKGVCPLMLLPNFVLTEDVTVDTMHLVKVLLKDHVFALCKGYRLPVAPKPPKMSAPKKVCTTC